MANKDLRRASHKIPKVESVWWYEEQKGISVVIDGKAVDGLACVTIRWRAIRAALARKDKPTESK